MKIDYLWEQSITRKQSREEAHAHVMLPGTQRQYFSGVQDSFIVEYGEGTKITFADALSGVATN